MIGIGYCDMPKPDWASQSRLRDGFRQQVPILGATVLVTVLTGWLWIHRLDYEALCTAWEPQQYFWLQLSRSFGSVPRGGRGGGP